MAVEHGVWTMYGMDWDDPYRIRSCRELINWINEIGFLPFFKNEIEGFSAEEHTSNRYWWTGNKEQDPWEWREIIARSGEVAYGKFFHKKAGFISKEWFPYFANYRRDGYDFDARWEDGLASIRCKKIMDEFKNREEWMSHELKKRAGFYKGGEKNFSGIITELQMQAYLVIHDFRQKRNKKEDIDLINREDMLELTRRMTPARTSITRVAGCYIDREGEFDGSFNTNFLKLSGSDRARNLKLAKTVPFADTNKNLKKYEFAPKAQKPGSMRQLLMAMKECGLKNDALMDTFYDVVMERYHADSEYAVLVFHDRYDIPAKAADKERLGESEEMFEYLICIICPLSGEYEPGEPECGFLFPAFTDRCGDLNHVNVYQKNSGKPHMELVSKILGVE